MEAPSTNLSERAALHGRHPSDVLLVEDDDLVRYAVRRLLVAAHRSCAAAASVEEAQQLLAVHAPSLVLTDYNLAGRWTGIDLLAWMRRSPRLRGIPAVLMTGDDPESVRDALAAAGLADVEVVAKPFEPPELIAAVSRAAGGAAEHGSPPPSP
ncbi:MAG TPA: response regulator [Polyangia bacterium]|nr:response regulator [Polyangia bacterium]